MIPPRARLLIRTALLLAMLAIAPAIARAAPPASGNDQGAWVLALPRLGSAVLTHIDAASPLDARIVARMPIAPATLAAGDRCVVAAFPPERTDHAEFRPFRLVSIAKAPNGLDVFSQPEPLPPLPTGAPLAGLIVVDGVIAALTISPAALWTCDSNAWSSTPLPDAADDAESLWLVRAQGRIGICAIHRDGNATLSTTTPRDQADARVWTTDRIALPPRTTGVLSIASQLLAVYPSEDGAHLIVAMVRPTDWIDRATLPIDDAPPTVAPLGDRLLAVTTGDVDPLRTHARVYGLDGSLAHEGPIGAASPLSPQDLQFVVFGVMGVVVAAMLFALRSESPSPITLPPGAVIAPPLRRLAAAAIDILPGTAAAVVAAITPASEAAALESVSTALAIGFFTTLILCAVPEAIFARTLGKWALGLRTISLTGDKPTWAQALGRTLSKLVFPPLGLLILMHPSVPPPGSCGTIVIMNRPPDADPASRP